MIREVVKSFDDTEPIDLVDVVEEGIYIGPIGETAELQSEAEVPSFELPVMPEEAEAVHIEEASTKKEITTETIAELYIKQGYFDKAIDIYRTLHEANPDNEEIKKKLDELERQVQGNIAVEGKEDKGESELEFPLFEEEEALIAPAAMIAQEQVLSPESEEIGAAKDDNVKKLESWLENIQKVRRRV